MKIHVQALFALTLVFCLTGCVIPVVHKTVKTPAIYGQVFDFVTKDPVQGARIAFVQKPSISCTTDASGKFVIDATHNVHFLAMIGPCGDEWPRGQVYTRFEITRDGYESTAFDVNDSKALLDVSEAEGGNKYVLRDVYLKPLDKDHSKTIQAWRASEENGDKPGIGYELRKSIDKVSGSAFILDPNFPHDFSHGLRLPMKLVAQTSVEVRFLVQWNEMTNETLVFRFKEEVWPELFEATVTQISATEQFAAQTYTFKAVK